MLEIVGAFQLLSSLLFESLEYPIQPSEAGGCSMPTPQLELAAEALNAFDAVIPQSEVRVA